MLTADFGSQEHVFTPVQAYIHKKMDSFFQVTQAELDKSFTEEEMERIKEIEKEGKPFLNLRRVDTKPNSFFGSSEKK